VVDVSGSVQEDISVAASQLHDTGTIHFDDADFTDLSSVTHQFISAVASTGASISSALDAALRNLAQTFTISGPGVVSPASGGQIDWQFNLSNALTQYLAAGETITVTYRITATDDSGYGSANGANAGNANSQDVVITISGTTDVPVTAVVDTYGQDTAGPARGEINLGLAQFNGDYTESGIIRFADVDLTDRPVGAWAFVGAVFSKADTTSFDSARWSVNSRDQATTLSSLQSGTFAGGWAFKLDPAVGNSNSGAVNWTYQTSQLATAFLRSGETAELTYRVSVDDGHGGVRSEDVIVLIRANSPPQALNDAATVKEDGGTTAIATGNLTANDPDLESDPLSISEIRLGALEGSGSSGVILPALGGQPLFSNPGTGTTPVLAKLSLLNPSFGRFEAGESSGITLISGDNSSEIVLSASWSRLNDYLQSPGFKLTINPEVRDPVVFSAELFQQVNNSH
jgi:VCBS repeat-containing protein